MHKDLQAILTNLKAIQTSNFVFPDNDGGFWRMRFERHLKKIADLAGIEGFTRAHDLRHTCGFLLRRTEAKTSTVMAILRHQSIQDSQYFIKHYSW